MFLVVPSKSRDCTSRISNGLFTRFEDVWVSEESNAQKRVGLQNLMPVLNDGDLPARQACDGDVFAGSLSRKLQKLMLRMKGEHMSEDGRSVDYRALRKSEVFKEYQEKTLLLRTVDIRSLQENDRLAFYISNYYYKY